MTFNFRSVCHWLSIVKWVKVIVALPASTGRPPSSLLGNEGGAWRMWRPLTICGGLKISNCSEGKQTVQQIHTYIQTEEYRTDTDTWEPPQIQTQIGVCTGAKTHIRSVGQATKTTPSPLECLPSGHVYSNSNTNAFIISHTHTHTHTIYTHREDTNTCINLQLAPFHSFGQL